MKNIEAYWILNQLHTNWIKKLQLAKLNIFILRLEKIIKDELIILQKSLIKTDKMQEYEKKVNNLVEQKLDEKTSNDELVKLNKEYKKEIDENLKKQEEINNKEFKPSLPTIKEIDLPLEMSIEQLSPIIDLIK